MWGEGTGEGQVNQQMDEPAQEGPVLPRVQEPVTRENSEEPQAQPGGGAWRTTAGGGLRGSEVPGLRTCLPGSRSVVSEEAAPWHPAHCPPGPA